MGRRSSFGGLFRVTLCSIVAALAGWSGAQTPHTGPGGSYAARGRVCLYVNLQDEFDRTVKAVTQVLDTGGDPALQEKLNRTIYKGLLNGVLGGSSAAASAAAYLDDAEEALPEADQKVVQRLEEAGFVALANLARRDYALAPGTSGASAAAAAAGAGVGSQSHDADGAARVGGAVGDRYGVARQEGAASDDDDVAGGKQKQHCHSAASDGICRGESPETAGAKPAEPGSSPPEPRSSLPREVSPPMTGGGSGGGGVGGGEAATTVARDTSQRPIGEAPDSHVTAAGQSAGRTSVGDAPDGGRVFNEDGVPIIEEDLYWSAEVEAATPKGFSQAELDEWKTQLSEQHVRSFEPGSFTKCGRDKNRFIVLDDGSKLCVRYRYPLITSMTGELYSYHLARMLGITNLPPLHVSMATTNGSFWRDQTANFQEAGWEDGRPVLLTKWIAGLDKAYLPETLVQGPYPIGSHTRRLRSLNMTELTYLLQWSDLILFDYLIAHFDRFTINLSSVRYYNDTGLLRSQVHNLVRDPATKQLWIVDNESGLLDGYSYLLVDGSDDSLLQGLLHEEMLGMLCLFRRSTGDRVRALLDHPEPARLLTERVRRADPDAGGAFPSLAGIHRHAQMLGQRLRQIRSWMDGCQQRNARERLKG